jgi:hypothetical protein
MDTARCQQLAEQLHTLLMQQLGMGLDVARMVGEPLYARDVLLVCAAHPGTALAALAWEYRDAATPTRPKSRVSDRAVTPSPAPVLKAEPGTPASRRRVAAPDSDHGEDTSPPTHAPRSRFSRLSLSRFSASIFGGSLFEGTIFGSPRPDPVTDFGDESFLAPPQVPPPQGAAHAKSGGLGAQRRSRWFGR